jgi:hypothetical protein
VPGRGTAAAVLLAGSMLLAGCSGATGPATKVTATSATLTALGRCDGGIPAPCMWRWRYRPVGTSAWAVTPLRGPLRQHARGLLRQAVTGLRPGTLYEVQFGGQGDRLARFAWRGPSVRFRTAPSAAARDPSGETMPVGNLPGWRQVFADDFRTAVPLGRFPAAVAQRWWAYPTSYHDTSNHGTYDPGRTTRVSGGLLRIHLHTAGGRARVAAPVPRIPGTQAHGNGSPGGLRYGRYSVRFRSDPVPGYKTAWLLWPDSGRWPADGEIDFPEGNLDATISGYVHRVGGRSGGDQAAFRAGATYGRWHTATTEWTPGLVRFFLDHRLVGATTSRVPSTPMHWVLQTETRLSGGAPPPSAAGDVLVDWVTAYRR